MTNPETTPALLRILRQIMTFASHDEDCHIDNWAGNQIPECTCGCTYALRDAWEMIEKIEADHDTNQQTINKRGV
jgi:hypothetical protein